jgi:hypothetical protein
VRAWLSPFYFLDLGFSGKRFFEKRSIYQGQNQKRPQRDTKIPFGAYRMGIFRKIHFINPPEVQGQVVSLLIYG